MDILTALGAQIDTAVPEAIYQHALQSDLARNALAAVVKEAAHTFANQFLESNPMASQMGGLLGQVAGLLGQGGGANPLAGLALQALEGTDLDERLRDAVTQGFTRSLQDNAPQLGAMAMEGVKLALQD